jgi:plastocyanin
VGGVSSSVRAVRLGGLVVFVGLALTLPALAATKTVTLQNIQFNPASVTINVGDKITWRHDDGPATHTVTSDSGQAESFDSGAMLSGATFSHTFKKAGTYTYYCSIHGSPGNCSGMCGDIVVSASATPPPTSAPTGAPPSQAPAASTEPPHVQEAVPLTATPLGLPTLTPPPTLAPGETVRPFGTPLAVAKNANTPAGRGPIAGLAIAAVLVSTVAAVSTWLRYGREGL